MQSVRIDYPGDPESAIRTSGWPLPALVESVKTTLLMVNPVAGGGRAIGIWDRLVASRPELEDAKKILTSDAASAREQLVDHLAEGVERVVALGGDGTAHLVVNALCEGGHGDRVAFGIVPAGTGSDLARSLELPRNPEVALSRVLDAAPRSIDVLEIRADSGARRFAVNTTSAGLSGVVNQLLEKQDRRGRFTYLAATLRALARPLAMRCRVEADGEALYDGDIFLLAMTNGRYFGQGMRVAPQARLDDGLLDMVVIPPVPRWKLPYLLPHFLNGSYVRLAMVETRRARKVRIEVDPQSPPYELDGEIFPSGPAEIRVVPGALRVLA